MTNTNFINKYRTSVNDMLTARQNLKTLRELSDATGVVPSLVQEKDFSGNEDLTPADLQAALDTTAALENILTDFTTTPPTPKPALTALLKFVR